MANCGLKPATYEIRLNNRKIMNYIFHDLFKLSDDEAYTISKLIDKKDKISHETFVEGARAVLKDNTDEFVALLMSKNFEEFRANFTGKNSGKSCEKVDNTAVAPVNAQEHAGIMEIQAVMDALDELGITNVRFDQTLMRGFDYYTGTVFEIFDTSPENRRAVLGGGRYDDLLSLFDSNKTTENNATKVPAVGFGTGDVIIRDLLETYGLLPTYKPHALLAIIPMSEANEPYANDVAQSLRAKGVVVVVDYVNNKKVGDKIKAADKRGIPFVVVIGDDEQKSGQFKVKKLQTGKEEITDENTCAKLLSI